MSNDERVLQGDEAYHDRDKGKPRVFDASLLEESLKILRKRAPLVHAREDNVTNAIRAMQREQRGCVLITEDGSANTRLIGIFSERDVLYRIVNRGRNPATLPLGEVMTRDPECLPEEAPVAWVLNKMAIGGFRHVPVVDTDGRPVFVVSVAHRVRWNAKAPDPAG